MERKGIIDNVSVDIKLVIDISKITTTLVSAWLFHSCVIQRGKHQINIDGKQTPVDQAEIEEELQKAINNKKREHKQ